MRRWCFFFCFAWAQSIAQYPDLSAYKINESSAISLKINGCFLNKACYEKQRFTKAEVPPWSITLGNNHLYFLVNGRATYIWTTSDPLTLSVSLKKASSKHQLATLPYISEAAYAAVRSGFDWKRNYHGIYTAQVISQSKAGSIVIGFSHGENKNEVFAENCFTGESNGRVQNTIQPNTPIDCANPATWSGGKPYHDGWDAYNGILSAAWTNTAEPAIGSYSFHQDLGPIAWPSMAYMTVDSIKTTNGLRHPSSIIHGDSIYVFYIEAGVYKGWSPSEEGRTGGVKVIRVHKEQALNPTAYEAYYKATTTAQSIWSPSLPVGFSKERMLQYVTTKGPKTTDVLDDNNQQTNPVRFSVAKVRGKDYFIGVEEYQIWNDPSYYLAVRYSSNLVDWSAPQILYKASSWEAFNYHYPIFLDKNGETNTEVDQEEFYIIGTPAQWKNTVNRLLIYK